MSDIDRDASIRTRKRHTRRALKKVIAESPTENDLACFQTALLIRGAMWSFTEFKAYLSQFEMNVLALSLFRSGKSEADINLALRVRFEAWLGNGELWRMAQFAVEADPGTGQPNGYYACVPEEIRHVGR